MTVHSLPLIGDDEQHLAFVGDWHGNTRWAVYCIELLGLRGIKSVMSMGDFGIWHGAAGAEYLGKVSRALKNFDMKIYVTLGNHENYDLIDSLEKDEQGITWFRDNIAVLPRVYGFKHYGLNFLSLGGAPSIDFQYRTPGLDWWPQEMISDEDVERALETAKELGGVDVMMTHDAPDGGTRAVSGILSGNPMGWSRSALEYASEGRMQMNKAVYGIMPSLLVHGHYHVYDYGYIDYGEGRSSGAIVSLEPDGNPHNISIFDLENLLDPEISWGRHNLGFRRMVNND